VRFLPLPMRRFIGNLSNFTGFSDNADLVEVAAIKP
jgi:hypothetical protein